MTPFDLIPGQNPAVFVFADHASNHVPDWIGGLGSTDMDAQRHIAWDIGTEWVARELCRELNCGGLICGFSRLVIDANRDLRFDGLIPSLSDGTLIPANVDLSEAQRQDRIARLYTPYHNALSDALDARPNTLAISIHSFTPQLSGQAPRSTDIGMLVKDDPDTADRFIAALQPRAPDLRIEVNQPYSAYVLNHTVDHNVVPRGLRHLAIELRQDHIANNKDAVSMAHILARAIEPLLPEISDARNDD